MLSELRFYLKMTGSVYRPEEFGDVDLFVFIPVGQVHRRTSRNPDDVSPFNIDSVPLVLLNHDQRPSSCGRVSLKYQVHVISHILRGG